jgi:hypothetical protein
MTVDKEEHAAAVLQKEEMVTIDAGSSPPATPEAIPVMGIQQDDDKEDDDCQNPELTKGHSISSKNAFLSYYSRYSALSVFGYLAIFSLVSVNSLFGLFSVNCAFSIGSVVLILLLFAGLLPYTIASIKKQLVLLLFSRSRLYVGTMNDAT